MEGRFFRKAKTSTQGYSGMCQDTEIRFCHPDETPYGVLANFYPSPVKLDGVAYRTAEHAFQAFKAARPEVAQWIAAAPDGFLAAAIGDNLPEHEIVPGWEERREELMRPILWAKFSQNKALRQLLLNTKDAEPSEWVQDDNETNRFWSKVDGVGANVLGKLLMEVRGHLARPDASADDGSGWQGGMP